MKLKKHLGNFLVCVAMLAPTVSFAQQMNHIYCSGKIAQTFIDTVGVLRIVPDWRGDWLNLCSFQVALNGIEPATCRSWYSGVISAMGSKQTVSMALYVPVGTPCSATGTWGSSPLMAWMIVVANP